MQGSSLRLFALCNKYIQQHAADEEEEQDASLTALYLFCCVSPQHPLRGSARCRPPPLLSTPASCLPLPPAQTEKSLSLPSLFAPANAHSLLHRHRVATMERL